MKEGQVKVSKSVCVAKQCDVCEERATKKHTFLFENARNNPASSGYRGDDISWCADEKKYACDAHDVEVRRDAPDGMNWCGTFPNGSSFAHMFLEWKEVEKTITDPV